VVTALIACCVVAATAGILLRRSSPAFLCWRSAEPFLRQVSALPPNLCVCAGLGLLTPERRATVRSPLIAVLWQVSDACRNRFSIRVPPRQFVLHGIQFRNATWHSPALRFLTARVWQRSPAEHQRHQPTVCPSAFRPRACCRGLCRLFFCPGRPFWANETADSEGAYLVSSIGHAESSSALVALVAILLLIDPRGIYLSGSVPCGLRNCNLRHPSLARVPANSLTRCFADATVLNACWFPLFTIVFLYRLSAADAAPPDSTDPDSVAGAAAVAAGMAGCAVARLVTRGTKRPLGTHPTPSCRGRSTPPSDRWVPVRTLNRHSSAGGSTPATPAQAKAVDALATFPLFAIVFLYRLSAADAAPTDSTDPGDSFIGAAAAVGTLGTLAIAAAKRLSSTQRQYLHRRVSTPGR
jgi:hypothetical protein